MNALPYLEIGADAQPTFRFKKAIRDAEGEFVLDDYGNRTYEPMDLSVYAEVLIYLTIKSKETLVAKYKRTAGTGHYALDMTDEATGKVLLDIQRADTLDLEGDDILEAEIGYYTSSVGFQDSKFVRIHTQDVAMMIKPHKALRDAV